MVIKRTAQLKRHIQQFLKLKYLRRLAQKLSLRIRLVLALLMLMGFLSVILISLFPGVHSFELYLATNQLEFTIINKTSNNESIRPFLQDILGISEISIKGENSQPISLRGNFDKRLGEIKSLEFEMPYESSKIIFSYKERNVNSSSGISLNALNLQPETNVALSYFPAKRDINIDYSPVDPKAIEPGRFDVDFGAQPLELQLENCNILTSPIDPNILAEDKPIEYTPLGSEFSGFPLPVDGEFSIVLLSKPKTSILSGSKWLSTGLEVANVRFWELKRSVNNNFTDIYSSILEGKAYLKSKELSINPDQFLVVGPPGISKVTHIQIDEDRKVLDIRAWGKTSKIQVGLNKDYPLEEIRLNKLIQLGFSNEQMIAVVSFSSAMVASLLSWLIDNLFQSKK